jgi:hypothetical protein
MLSLLARLRPAHGEHRMLKMFISPAPDRFGSLIALLSFCILCASRWGDALKPCVSI